MVLGSGGHPIPVQFRKERLISLSHFVHTSSKYVEVSMTLEEYMSRETSSKAEHSRKAAPQVSCAVVVIEGCARGTGRKRLGEGVDEVPSSSRSGKKTQEGPKAYLRAMPVKCLSIVTTEVKVTVRSRAPRERWQVLRRLA